MRSTDNFDAFDYANYAGDVVKLAKDAIRNLAPRKGEKILDVGCGDGTITKLIESYGTKVIGIDANPDMVLAAKAKGINAQQQNVTKLTFKDKSFDKVFSNSTLHWIDDLPKAFSEIARVLKDGGTISFEFGQKSPPNITKAVVSTAREHGYDVFNKNPWHTSNPRDIKNTLKGLGFEDIKIKQFCKLQNLPNGIEDWLNNFVANTFYKDIPEKHKTKILTEVTESLKNYPNYFQLGNEPEWFADYERINVSASINKQRATILEKYTPAPVFAEVYR